MAQINQFRDSYSKQTIEIQLTNPTAGAVTVLAAVVHSPLFASGISWTSSGAGTELPPGQTKSLPAQLPAASCQLRPFTSQSSASQAAAEATATLTIQSAPDPGATVVNATAADPFGVLPRNNTELCVAEAAAVVADFRLGPDLDVAPDGRSAVLRLIITPRNPGGAVSSAGGGLTMESVSGTTLLEEDAGAPWPTHLRIEASGPERTLRLGIRPARCDPHAVAEDKVGTLVPLKVTVAGREGILKVDAGAQLRGRIYDFITNACGRQ
jgi:hypothetical protein